MSNQDITNPADEIRKEEKYSIPTSAIRFGDQRGSEAVEQGKPQTGRVEGCRGNCRGYDILSQEHRSLDGRI